MPNARPQRDRLQEGGRCFNVRPQRDRLQEGGRCLMPGLSGTGYRRAGNELGDDAAEFEFEEGGLAGADIGEGVVGVLERFVEEFAVEFHQIGVFELAHSSGNGAEPGGFLHGAASGFGAVGKGEFQADEFGAEDFFIERDVVGDQGLRLFDVGQGFLDGFRKVDALFQGDIVGDTVDADDIRRDEEALGADDAVAAGELVAGFIRQNPGKLNHAGPVIGVFDGRLPVAGQPGGFGVEEEQAGVGWGVEIEKTVHFLNLSLRQGDSRGKGGGGADCADAARGAVCFVLGALLGGGQDGRRGREPRMGANGLEWDGGGAGLDSLRSTRGEGRWKEGGRGGRGGGDDCIASFIEKLQ